MSHPPSLCSPPAANLAGRNSKVPKSHLQTHKHIPDTNACHKQSQSAADPNQMCSQASGVVSSISSSTVEFNLRSAGKPGITITAVACDSLLSGKRNAPQNGNRILLESLLACFAELFSCVLKMSPDSNQFQRLPVSPLCKVLFISTFQHFSLFLRPVPRPASRLRGP